MTKQHPLMTPCWFLIMRAVGPLLAPSAPYTPPQAVETRTTTTLVTGGHAFASCLTYMAEGMINTLNLQQKQLPLPPLLWG